MKLYIKNMGCECCTVLVKEEIEKLGLKAGKIGFGEAEIKGEVSEGQHEKLKRAIQKAGLEIIESKRAILLEKIKVIISQYVNDFKEKPQINFSDYLVKELPYDYAYLTSFFSEFQATTIEQYLIKLKIEKVKDYILQGDLTLTEIADKLHYSSVAHLSAQFKKVTGITPTHFKKLRDEDEEDTEEKKIRV
ncbi:MAG: helix-turn-helix domain-containing protein [Bacteroidota bacterium]